MFVKSPSQDPVIQQTDSGIQICIPARKHIFDALWYCIILAFLVYIFGNVLYFGIGIFRIYLGGWNSLDARGKLAGIGFIPILFSLPALSWPIVYALLWQVGGRELIEVTPQTLTITHQLFGWKRLAVYPANQVKDLRVEPPPKPLIRIRYVPKLLLAKKDLIAFEYGKRTICFGYNIDITEAEARRIVTAIRRQLA